MISKGLSVRELSPCGLPFTTFEFSLPFQETEALPSLRVVAQGSFTLSYEWKSIVLSRFLEVAYEMIPCLPVKDFVLLHVAVRGSHHWRMYTRVNGEFIFNGQTNPSVYVGLFVKNFQTNTSNKHLAAIHFFHSVVLEVENGIEGSMAKVLSRPEQIIPPKVVKPKKVKVAVTEA